jgi:hypothetical protein
LQVSQICGSSSWCVGWSNEAFSPSYDTSAALELAKWTGDDTCQNTPNDGNTSATSNQNWYNQSIVETYTGKGIFQYPNTNLQAWLCASVSSGAPTPSPNQNTPQGWLFYQEVTLPANNYMTAVQSCYKAEGFTNGTITAGLYNGYGGFTAVATDMATGPGLPSLTGQCAKSPGR